MSDFEARARKAADAVRRRIDEIPAHHDEGIRRAQRSPARFAIPTAVAAAVLIGAVAIGTARVGGGTTSGAEGAAAGPDGAAFALTGALKPFATCDTVLQYFKDQAPEYLIERAAGRGTATAGGDYTGPTVVTLTFAPGQTTATVTFTIIGDRSKEANETVLVQLSNASGATIGDGQGALTIVNDD